MPTEARAKPTPGPWCRSPEGGRIFGANGKLVAWTAGAGLLPDEEILANADLLAAAPELLTWLKWYVAGSCGHPEALAAIAKAEDGL